LLFSEAADYSKDSLSKPVFHLCVGDVDISPAAYSGRNVLRKPNQRHWIPAFAGTTEKLFNAVGLFY